MIYFSSSGYFSLFSICWTHYSHVLLYFMTNGKYQLEIFCFNKLSGFTFTTPRTQYNFWKINVEMMHWHKVHQINFSILKFCIISKWNMPLLLNNCTERFQNIKKKRCGMMVNKTGIHQEIYGMHRTTLNK